MLRIVKKSYHNFKEQPSQNETRVSWLLIPTLFPIIPLYLLWRMKGCAVLDCLRFLHILSVSSIILKSPWSPGLCLKLSLIAAILLDRSLDKVGKFTEWRKQEVDCSHCRALWVKTVDHLKFKSNRELSFTSTTKADFLYLAVTILINFTFFKSKWLDFRGQSPITQ